jgi:hypothetical protein
MYMQEGKPEASTAPLPWPLKIALATSVVGIFFLGLFPGEFLILTRLAATVLP